VKICVGECDTFFTVTLFVLQNSLPKFFVSPENVAKYFIMSEPIRQIKKWAEPYNPNPAMLRLLLDREGYQVFQWCDQPNSMYGNHKHPEDQIHWIVSGRFEITIDKTGETYILEMGDRDFIPAETYHSARVIGDEPVMYLVGAKV
jgi:quercetin dioxygenase-like cupin family protein